MLNITFKYNYSFPGHGDIHFIYKQLNLDVWADSYYLLLDDHILPHIETFEKAKVVQKRILENWQYMIKNMKDGDSTLLPLDLQDQGIGLLYVQDLKEFLEIKYGVTEKYQGYSFIPSLTNYLAFEESDLRLFDGTHVVSKKDFLENLKEQELSI